MARKKLSEMTPWERVLPRLKGLSNDEAEDIAVKILAQVISKHRVSIGDGDEHLKRLSAKIADASFEYTQQNAGLLSMAKVMREFKKSGHSF